MTLLWNASSNSVHLGGYGFFMEKGVEFGANAPMMDTMKMDVRLDLKNLALDIATRPGSRGAGDFIDILSSVITMQAYILQFTDSENLERVGVSDSQVNRESGTGLSRSGSSTIETDTLKKLVKTLIEDSNAFLEMRKIG